MIFNRSRIRNYYFQRGVTLVELVVFIVVVAIISLPLSVIIREAMCKAALPEHLSIAGSLARQEIENTTNQQFASTTDVAETSYTGNFSQYSYEISVDNVASSSLNTPVADDSTDYKRVEITIRRGGFPSVSVVTLVTNN